ncbi:MAG: hypothetical protein CM15mP70_00990 [Pelagibacteraceae bacterium]|nr:MAG: hypothetical protein CM15mP70_00990 [Pelagibacteraceae bacterium]
MISLLILSQEKCILFLEEPSLEKPHLLKTIAGLLTPDSGNIQFEGKDFLAIPVWERNVAMVYQQFINYPHLNVKQNIEFPLKQRKMDPKFNRKRG